MKDQKLENKEEQDCCCCKQGEECKEGEKCEDCKECKDGEKCKECCEECDDKKVLLAEFEQEKNARLEVLADYINYRKRVEKEKDELRVTANKEMLHHIIEVMADFDRAVEAGEKVDQKTDFYQGVMLIRQKLKVILDQYGLKDMDIKPGSDFDPLKMEAIATDNPTGKVKSGKVLQVFQKGFIHKDSGKIYKTAKVVIAK